MTRSKLEKMARYSANIPPRWWNESSYEDYQIDADGWRQYVDEVSRTDEYCGETALTEDDRVTLEHRRPMVSDPENLRPALEYIFGDDDALKNTDETPF